MACSITGSSSHSRPSRKITLPKLKLSFGYQQISGKVQSIVFDSGLQTRQHIP